MDNPSMDNLPHGKLAPWTTHPIDNSPHVKLAPWTLTTWNIRPQHIIINILIGTLLIKLKSRD
jgi:hypothetical protein